MNNTYFMKMALIRVIQEQIEKYDKSEIHGRDLATFLQIAARALEQECDLAWQINKKGININE